MRKKLGQLNTIVVFWPHLSRKHKLKKYYVFFTIFCIFVHKPTKIFPNHDLKHCPNRWGHQVSGNIIFLKVTLRILGEKDLQSSWMHWKVHPLTKIGGVKKTLYSISGSPFLKPPRAFGHTEYVNKHMRWFKKWTSQNGEPSFF